MDSMETGPKPGRQTWRRKLSGKEAWGLFVAGAGILAVLVTFSENASKPFKGAWAFIENMRGDSEEQRRLARFEGFLSMGQFSDAQQLAQGFAPESGAGKLAARLLESFNGPRKWDSKDERGREALLAELKDLPDCDLNREAQILLQYRLRHDGSLPSQYFRSVETRLKSPHVRFLAAREAESDTSWAIRILRSVIAEASDRRVCGLEVQARVWLARTYRRNDNWREVQSILPPLEEQFKRCGGLGETTVEVRLRGELLRLARHESDNVSAETQRGRLANLARMMENDTARDARSVSLNAHYWVADDLLSDSLPAAAQQEIELGLKLAEGDADLRLSYPYVSAMLSVLWARSRMRQDDWTDEVQRHLASALKELERMSADSPGSFQAEIALCHYSLSELYFRRGNITLASKAFQVAEGLRSKCPDKGLPAFDYDTDRERISHLMRTTEAPEVKAR